jgi:hypothetical protein
MERAGYDYGEDVFRLICEQLEQIMAHFQNDLARVFLNYFLD